MNRLRQFLNKRLSKDRCELCSLEIGKDHVHLARPDEQKLLCACEPCAVLFSHQQNGRFKRISQRRENLAGFEMSETDWDGFQIPIGLAFFFKSSRAGKIVAFYPSVLGPVECMLDLKCWEQVLEKNPVLQTLEPDIEALLVNRLKGAGDYYLLPVDQCYRLVGILRKHWRGFLGGPAVEEELGLFFKELKEKSVYCESP